jgi:hypothetical protein
MGSSIITHRWNDEFDYTKGGRFVSRDSPLLATWTFELEVKILHVRHAMATRHVNLSSFDIDRWNDELIKAVLVDMANDTYLAMEIELIVH